MWVEFELHFYVSSMRLVLKPARELKTLWLNLTVE